MSAPTVEAGAHVPTISALPWTSAYLVRCPDCRWTRRYESTWEAELFAQAHHRRLGQIPGQLALAVA